MSRDRGTQAQDRDFGYGAVCDEGGQMIEGLVMADARRQRAALGPLRRLVGAAMIALSPDDVTAAEGSVDHLGPLGMEPLPGRLVDAFVGVGPEEVALRLQQVGRQARTAQAVVVGQ